MLLLFGNASIHRNIQIQIPLHQLVLLRPYSPVLHSCEEAFSSFKSHAKPELATEHNFTRIGDQSAAVAVGVNLHNWRTTILKEIGEESLQTITCLLYTSPSPRD